MCYRPEIHFECCGLPLTASSDYHDRYVGAWKPPVVEHCAEAKALSTPGFACPTGVKWKAYPSAAWATYPAACPGCERKYIRAEERSAEVRAQIDACFDAYQRTGGRWMDRRIKMDILRVARAFFKGAFWKRFRQGTYGEKALERVQSWKRLLEHQGPQLRKQYQYAKDRLLPMVDLDLKILREEMAAWWPEISADTVMLVDLLLQQRVLFRRFGPRDVEEPEIFQVSAAIGNLRAKYFAYPGEEGKLMDERDESDEEVAWKVVGGQQGL